MGTTIDGVYYGGKDQRRRNALKRLEEKLKIEMERSARSDVPNDLTIKDIQRINTEIQNLKKKL